MNQPCVKDTCYTCWCLSVISRAFADNRADAVDRLLIASIEMLIWTDILADLYIAFRCRCQELEFRNP